IPLAYVADHRIVIQSEQFKLVGISGAVTTYAGTMTAVLVPFEDGSKRFKVEDGVIAGRVALPELVSNLGSLSTGQAGPPVPLCKTPFWAVTQASLCQSLDVM